MLIVLPLLAACGEDPAHGVQEEASVQFNVGIENGIQVSRALTVAMPKSIVLKVIPLNLRNGADPAANRREYTLKSLDGTFSRISVLAEGNYQIESYNYINEAVALKAAERGMPWYHFKNSADMPYQVAGGKLNNVSLSMGIENSMIRLHCDNSWTEEAVYSIYQTEVYTEDAKDRKLLYRNMDGEESGWFSAGKGIGIRIYFNYNGKKYYKDVTLGKNTLAGNCHHLTLKPSLGGTADVKITLDNVLARVEKIVQVDAEGAILLGSTTGIFEVGYSGTVDKVDDNIDFDPEL